jgi:sortase A
VVATYLAWLLWGTGLYTAQQQQELRRNIETRIAEAGDGPARRPPAVLKGDAYAIILIPRIGVDDVVVQGTSTVDLKKGPGHYVETADPWDLDGRVGIAGHRTTYGAPFWDLNRLSRGDQVLLRTEAGDYRYRVTRSLEVLPTQKEVLEQSEDPTLVLTTCTPRFSAAKRLVVFADRVGGRPVRAPAAA